MMEKLPMINKVFGYEDIMKEVNREFLIKQEPRQRAQINQSKSVI